jgi:hypothetical protein
MAEENKKTFVLTDESLNSSGFWLRTAGGDLGQFKKNPLMLWSHMRVWKGTEDEVLPIGRWDNVKRTESGQLIAEPVFDEKDPFAVKIKNKVDGGFLRMASVGIRVIETSADEKYLKPGQTRETVTKWKLVEASICDIGRNENALVFYDENDNLLTFAEGDTVDCPVKLIESLKTNENIKKLKMDSVIKLLNLAAGASETDVHSAVAAIVTERDTLKAEKDAREQQLKAEQQTKAETLTDAAIKDGRINDDEKHSVRLSWLAFFAVNFEAAEKSLAAIPAPKSVRDQMKDETMSETSGSAWAKRQKEIENKTKK